MERICSRCGCSSFHYNRNRMRMECNLCGAPIYDPQQDQQLMQYDRTYSQAMSHLAAGNWEQTISLLKPLLNQYPTEKKLYRAILRAATQDFRDLEMENTARKTAALEAWDKLIRLGGVTAEMLRYSRERYEKQRKKLSRQFTRILTWVFLAALCSVMAGVFYETEPYFIAVGCVGGCIGCLYKALTANPLRVIRQLQIPTPDMHHNPFL